mgnify:CR=1 FL=1
MKKLGKIKNYILAFIIPIVICLIFMYFKNILSDIEEIYTSDLRCQHIVFLNYFKSVLLGNASLFYTFSAGMGNSMLATIIFYCISPINFMLFIIEDMRYAIFVIYFIKMGLAGVSMYVLLKSKTGKESFMTVVFSTCYALCSFIINYFFCVFWFDCMYLAPMVMLGIDRIFEREKMSLLYIGSLALTIICNIQMGFGLCVYSVVYFIYSFNIRYSIKKDFKKFMQIGIIFIISSLCVGAISSCSLLGFLSGYMDVSSTRNIFSTSSGVSNILYILKDLFTVGNLTGEYNNYFEPYVYCGLIVTFFAILYMFNKNIDKKKRLHAFGVILFFIISFSVNIINLFWHLTPPISFNFRYSEYLSLFLVLIAYESYINKDKLLSKDIGILVISLLIGLFVILGFNQNTYVIHAFIFLVINFVVIILAKNKSKKFEILLVLLVFAELGVNGYLSYYIASELPYGKNTSYTSFKEIASKNEFDTTYRVEYNYSYTDYFNDSLLVNKNSSLRYFSSLVYDNVLYFFRKTGSVNGLTNYTVSAYDSPLLNSMLGNKYFYLLHDFNNGIYQKLDSYKVGSYDYVNAEYRIRDVYLFENPYALSLGYMIENDFKYEEGMNLVDYQNGLIKAFTGNDNDVLIRLNADLLNDPENCPTEDEFPYCASYLIHNNTNNKITYTYTPFSVYSISNKIDAYIDINVPLVLHSYDDDVNLVVKHNQDLQTDSFIAATYNKANLIQQLDILRKNMLDNVIIDKNILTGDINTDKNGTLFLSIPYDKKFKIYVDGVETDYYSLLDNTFIGLDLTEGEHKIKMEYINSGWKYYVMSSVVAVIITGILYVFINKKITKKKKQEERIKEEILLEREKKNQIKKEKNTKKKKKK